MKLNVRNYKLNMTLEQLELKNESVPIKSYPNDVMVHEFICYIFNYLYNSHALPSVLV